MCFPGLTSNPLDQLQRNATTYFEVFCGDIPPCEILNETCRENTLPSLQTRATFSARLRPADSHSRQCRVSCSPYKRGISIYTYSRLLRRSSLHDRLGKKRGYRYVISRLVWSGRTKQGDSLQRLLCTSVECKLRLAAEAYLIFF